MGVPFAVGIEADCSAIIVDAEQLIHRSLAYVRVLVGGKDAVPLDKTEGVPVPIAPEANRVSMIVDGRDLGLH